MRRLVKINLEGPINYKMQFETLQILNKLRDSFKYSVVDGLSIVINSYGGSIIYAKSIANSLKAFRSEKQVPILCFAQDFCLNSANLILSVGNKSYANKFSLMGDYGFVYEGVDEEEFTKKYNIGIQKISSINPTYINKARFGPLRTLRLKDKSNIQNMLNTSAQQLIEGICQNRKLNIQTLYGSKQKFIKEVLSNGIVDPVDGVSFGLIDQLASMNDIIERDFSQAKVMKMNDQLYPHPILNLIHNLPWYWQKR